MIPKERPQSVYSRGDENQASWALPPNQASFLPNVSPTFRSGSVRHGLSVGAICWGHWDHTVLGMAGAEGTTPTGLGLALPWGLDRKLEGRGKGKEMHSE